MYNPYNWNIEKTKVKVKRPCIWKEENKICILDELCEVNNRLDMAKIKIREYERDLVHLEKRKVDLLNKLMQ